MSVWSADNQANVRPTIVGLEQLAGGGEEVLQLEVTGSLQCHAKALGVPASLPQDVLRKASRASAHVAKIKELACVILRQGPLHSRHSFQFQHMEL